MITIKEIAKMANVSAATVSHVINGTAKISPETTKRVMDVINKVNYKPNSIAKSLKIKRTNTIGIITEDITVFNTPEIINGINEHAENCGYHIILNNLRLYKRIGNNYKDTSKFTDLVSDIVGDLVNRQVDGIIYVGAHCRDITGLIENVSVPIVYTYCYTNNESDISIYYDDELAAYEATKHLIMNNHRKIGVITGSLSSIQCQERLKGYQRALYDNNILFNPQFMKIGNWELEQGYLAAKELLSLPDAPTAIFSMNDVMAGGVIEAAKELGISIPKELSLVGFDNRECSYSYSPKLTTMSLPLYEIGKKGAEILIKMINDKKSNKTTNGHNNIENKIKLNCALIQRESVFENPDKSF